MRIGFYGNNLNFGYFFVQSLRAADVDAYLLCPNYLHQQEQHSWWTAVEKRPEWIRPVPSVLESVFSNSRDFPTYEELYRFVHDFDALLLAEDGPAVFSDLTNGPVKIFVSFGFDLQNAPFLVSRYLSEFWRETIPNTFRNMYRGHLGASLLLLRTIKDLPATLRRRYSAQMRQRRGLERCDRLAISPYQDSYITALKLDRAKVIHLPLPMDTSVLLEADAPTTARLRATYAAYDFVFLHPTRQFYLPHNNDPLRKDNDKLLLGFAEFQSTTRKNTRLLLIRKGDSRDIAHSEHLIRKLRMEDSVEWLDEMPNRVLRSYFKLPNVVVCDQFSPLLASLGNIGREASFFGRPLITAFEAWNQRLYGNDKPPHVYGASSAQQVTTAMNAISDLSSGGLQELSASAMKWFGRTHASEAIIPRWIELVRSLRRKTFVGN